jgi:uncharacterized protein DUF4160
MPRISQFFGITIAMFYNDHSPAHFHALYAEFEATFSVDGLETISGHLPNRAAALVVEWAALHRAELQANWEKARRGVSLDAIDPLR